MGKVSAAARLGLLATIFREKKTRRSMHIVAGVRPFFTADFG